MENNMTIKEIDKQITELQNLRYIEEQKEIAKFKEKAKNNIGRCFILGGRRYVKVIDIPREKYSINGSSFNKYQYPALFLGSKTCPFEFDTLFSAAWGEGNDVLGIDYKEISKEEFMAKFEEVMSDFRDRIAEM